MEYLSTGDLGFLHKGELYICGRSKDLIIVRGSNHYPQDIERTAERSEPSLRAGCSAAFSVPHAEGHTEAVVYVAEVTPPPTLSLVSLPPSLSTRTQTHTNADTHTHTYAQTYHSSSIVPLPCTVQHTLRTMPLCFEDPLLHQLFCRSIPVLHESIYVIMYIIVLCRCWILYKRHQRYWKISLRTVEDAWQQNTV